MNAPSTPRVLRLLVPALVLASASVFAHANANVGTIINGTLRAGKLERTFHVWDFSLWQSVQDFWDAKTYVLAFFIALWSGLWPYVKSAMLFSAWVLPPHVLSVTWRRRFIWILSFLAKYAMLDIYLLVIFDVGFRFHLDVATAAYLRRLVPKDLMTFDLTVEPALVSFTFITASIVVIALISVAEAYHRNAVAVASPRDKDLPTHAAGDDGRTPRRHRASAWFWRIKCPRGSWFEHATEEIEWFEHQRGGSFVDDNDDDDAIDRSLMAPVMVVVEDERFVDESKRSSFGLESISNHAFDRMHGPALAWTEIEGGRFVMRPWARASLVLVLCGAAVSVYYGAAIDSFSFRFTELAGEALDFLEPGSNERRYSLLDLMRGLSREAFVVSYGGDMSPALKVGVTYLQTIFVWFAMAWPLTEITVMVAVWLIPLTLRDQKICYYALTVCASMASLEVFSIAVIVSVTNLERFSVFLQGDKCDAIIETFGVECFRVRTDLLPGCWVLFVASFTVLAVASTVFRFAETVLLEREQRALRNLLQAKGVPAREAERRIAGQLPTNF